MRILAARWQCSAGSLYLQVQQQQRGGGGSSTRSVPFAIQQRPGDGTAAGHTATPAPLPQRTVLRRHHCDRKPLQLPA